MRCERCKHQDQVPVVTECLYVLEIGRGTEFPMLRAIERKKKDLLEWQGKVSKLFLIRSSRFYFFCSAESTDHIAISNLLHGLFRKTP